MDTLVSLLSSRTDESNDSSIIEHVSNFQDRLVSDWTYAAGTSNHSQYGTFTLALATALDIPSLNVEVATNLAKRIINDELKVVYRALTMVRQAQTIPSISLLKQLAKFAPAELVSQFDFTLRVIPKLLAQQPFRKAFLEFYMVLIQKSSAPVRRELLANRKVFSGWFGKLGTDDTEEMIGETLDLLKTLVLKDTTVFSKSTKMGLFNDWTLRNLQRILSSPTVSETVADKISSFACLLLCDRRYGVKMPGENKLALSFLKIIKPWENTVQMGLCLRLLTELPEVQVPYFENLSTAYPLTPKLSMWWFSYSVLHIRTLKLDVPPVKSTALPKLEIMSKSVIPVTITKQALHQALATSESSLIQFQAAQIVLFALRRLRRAITEIYEPRGWDSNALVDDILATRLPDPQIFTREVNQSLLQTTYLIILNEFCHLRLFSININMPLAPEEVSGLQLVQAQQILEVQTFTSDQTRWWNPNKGEASLFTQLIKFATFNFSLAGKSSELLQYLVQPTQLFADLPTVAHPIDALLFTLSSNYQRYGKSMDLCWDLLEQTIQRVARSPYQYIDKAKSPKVSPLIVALVEQYTQHFASKENSATPVAKLWIREFARSLVVLGEDKSRIDELCASLNSKSVEAVRSDEYFDFVLDESDKIILNRNDILLKISNRLELAATIYRIVTTDNAQLRNYLLANIPADMLNILVQDHAAFAPFINGDRNLCKTLLIALDGKTSDELQCALEQSAYWDLAIAIVSTSFLVDQLQALVEGDNNEMEVDKDGDEDEDKKPKLIPKILQELTSRKEVVSIELAQRLIDLPELVYNLQLLDAHSLDLTQCKPLLDNVDNRPKLAAVLVRITGFYDSTHPLAFNPHVLVAAAKFAPAKVDSSKALQVSNSLLKKKGFEKQGLSVAAEFLGILGADEASDLVENIYASISEYIEAAKQGSQSALLPDLVHIAKLSPPFLSRWLKVAVHQLTRSCAEHKLNADVVDFISSFNSETSLFVALWQNVHPNAINALIESFLRDASLPQAYEMVSRIALKERDAHTGSSSHVSKLNSRAHLATVFETTKPRDCSLDIILAIYSLFVSNAESNSTLDVEQGIIVRYDGSFTPKDRVLLQILEQIESNRQRSWVDNVESWEVRPASFTSAQDIDDYGYDPLVMAKGDSALFVTLDEQRIRTTIQSFELQAAWALPCESTEFADLLESIEHYEVQLPEGGHRFYDAYFLLGCVVSCNYLMENLEIFLNSGLLSFVICCLSHWELASVAVQVLKRIFKLLPESSFKDQVGTRLLIGKLLALQSESKAKQQAIPSHISGMAGQLALIISRPNHFMYEKVCRWLLASPKIRDFDVPLFKAIMESQSDMKSRELIWLFNTLKSGAVDNNAVQTYTRAGIIEWCMSQYNIIGHKTDSLKQAAAKLVRRIEEVRGGSNLLISHNGGLGMPEFKQEIFYSAGPDQVTEWTQQVQ